MFKNKFMRLTAVFALASGALIVPTVSGATTTTTVIQTVDDAVSGWNNLTSANNDYRLGQIMNKLWPSTFYLDNHGANQMDTNIISAATSSIKAGVQTVVYTINPRAVWSDGTALNADDFIYIYQVSSGNTAFKDKDGSAYDVAGTSGYDQIASVVGSLPKNAAGAALTCSAGSTANRNAGLCPNGKTVTVTFKANKPYPEWQGLFALVPAHIARNVGFNTGMDNDADALDNIVSAGPYKLSSFNRDMNTYTVIKNPSWWGTPAKVDRLVFKDLGSDANGIAGLAAGDYNVFEPTSPTKAIVDAASDQVGTVNDQMIPGYTFEHLDFNQANTDLKNLKVRQAIAYGISRSALIAATVGSITTTSQLNNHIFMSNQPGYKDNGKAYNIGGSSAGQKKAKDLLTAAGYKWGTDGYFHKGSTTGTRLGFDLWTNGTTARSTEAQIIQGALRQIGIVIRLHVAPNGDIFDAGVFDMVIFAWVGSPFLSGNADIYGCNGGNNFNNYCNTKLTNDMKAANSSTSFAAEAAAYNKADVTLWNDLPTLPLYQKPQYAAWTSNVHNVLVNPTQAGINWNAEKWTIN